MILFVVHWTPRFSPSPGLRRSRRIRRDRDSIATAQREACRDDISQSNWIFKNWTRPLFLLSFITVNKRLDPIQFSIQFYADTLLDRIEQLAFEGTLALGCDLADPNMKGLRRRLLNEAWRVFWQSTENYVEWERDKVSQLSNLA